MKEMTEYKSIDMYIMHYTLLQIHQIISHIIIKLNFTCKRG